MSGPLMASKSINVGRLAGAIARRVGRSDPCAVDAVGPEAHHKAVKAIIMAGRYLQEESDGKRVAFVAQKVQIEARGPQEPPTSILRLQAHLPAELAAPSPETPDIFVSRETNPGIAARDLADALLRQGGTASLGGMGPVAMSRALKTLIIAEVFRRKSLSAKQAILAMPQLLHVRVKDEHRVRFMLTCTKQP
eukprot:CAMPEP_0204521082 /NCGR_PEP_ID=MMETSP0661-20131031/5598_1 /ASSEMBLY_ACC=CAM_ASM_000606 /TAXON_ID=109239 /ORGANISM="Alexandrium margalefi, Strain AMGDE01CS-322" /LENGTH=192 /DNA_ID=CAMNT_0051526663 /DNA_START=138 /DNA_END=716 /DNA_ORIENTATION=+